MERPGYLKLWRGIVDKPIWKQSTPEHKAILIQILIMADFNGNEWEYKGEKYTTKPGQFVTSLKSIADECGKGISVQNVRSALARFERLGFITNESTKVNRLITIVNWGVYQANEKKTNKATNIVTNSEVTKNQQRGNKEVTTKEEVKKKRNKEDKKEYKKKINAFDFFQTNGFGILNQYTSQNIEMYLDAFDKDSDEIVQAALKIALDRNKVSWGYAKKILDCWINKNLKTIEEIRAFEKQQQATRKQTNNFSKSTQSKEITPEWLKNGTHKQRTGSKHKEIEDDALKRDVEAFKNQLRKNWSET